MRKYMFLLAVLLTFCTANAQILDPVHWSTEVKLISKNEYEIIFKAVLDEEWAIYSQTSNPARPGSQPYQPFVQIDDVSS